MTPQIDDGPRMPFGRYGIEPFRASGKRSPLRGHKSVAPATQVSRAPIRSRSGSKDTHGDWPEQSRTRVQRACPPPRRSKLRSLRFRLTAKTAYRCVASPLRTANASLVCASVGERRRERISSPCGVCTDHVQTSIRDRRRVDIASPFVTKASPSLSCADSTETERKRRQMSAGGLCLYA